MSQAHAAGAERVAAQLRAFLKEPLPHRGLFGGGRASLEAGHHVFKFAQGKFPPGIAHGEPEREELRRAAAAFIREVCFRDGASHYQLMCVAADAKREAIKENYHQLMALIHPDRAEGAREAWPADWAQRANRAYAVLDDAAARSVYDKALDAFTPVPPRQHRPARPRSRRAQGAKARVARAMLVLGAVISVLLLGYAWVAGFQDEHFPFTATTRGRGVSAAAERPRFLGAAILPARDDARGSWARAEAESSMLLRPLWPNPEPLPAMDPRAATFVPAARREVVAEKESLAPVRETPDIVAEPPPAAAIRREAPLPSPVAIDLGPSRAQIEILIARLIDYYEAGETDNLMALIDPKEAGVFATLRLRQTYADFFRATRERRLQVKKLDWQNVSASAQAQGQATVLAEYVDAPGKLERDIDVELEIALRNGQARITRLSLFPGAP